VKRRAWHVERAQPGQIPARVRELHHLLDIAGAAHPDRGVWHPIALIIWGILALVKRRRAKKKRPGKVITSN